jgi:hypothetical protein
MAFLVSRQWGTVYHSAHGINDGNLRGLGIVMTINLQAIIEWIRKKLHD